MIIEDEAKEETEKEDTRKRDDKPRTKLIRLCKKIPDFLLKKLVSTGDYKHEDLERLLVAYQTAFEGFISIVLFRNPDSGDFNELVNSLEGGDDLLMDFSTIHFPERKVRALSSDLLKLDETHLQKLLQARDSTSVKKLKEQMEHNRIVRYMFKLALNIVGEDNEFPMTTGILMELAKL